MILPVEDSPDDEELALPAFRKGQLANEVVVARDGAEVPDYPFASGPHAGRDPGPLPQVVLVDLKLPKVDGLEVLRRVRADPRTRRLPVVIPTSSRHDEDVMRGYDPGANSSVRKPADFGRFVAAFGSRNYSGSS